MQLNTAIGSYGVTRALKSGSLRSDRVGFDLVEIAPITKAMRQMVRGLAFDVCEMAFTTYLCARAAGKPFTAIPVFVTRNFHQWAAFRNARSGVRTPKDLEGRVVGVNRGYTVTTGVWIRGILATEYGVDLRRVTWGCSDDEHVAEFVPPPHADYRFQGQALAGLLESGAIDAAIGDVKSDSPDIVPLIPDAREAGFAWFRKTGIYPVNHTIVVRDALLAEHPWLAAELYRLFTAAAEAFVAEPAADAAAAALRAVVGNPFPCGLAANRKAVEALTGFAFDQQVIPSKPSAESLFAAGTQET